MIDFSKRAGGLTRRQSLPLAAFAILATGCDAQQTAAPPRNNGLGADLADPLARRFYALRQGRAAWNGPDARTLVQAIADARRHGLDPAALAPKSAADPRRQEENFTLAALAYAKALSSGFIDPGRVEPIFTLKRNVVDIPAGLAQALEAGRLSDWLDSLPPADDEYKALSDAYLSALGQTGLRAPPAQGAPVGTSTAPSDQARQLAANLERRRWLARTPPALRIDVNTAGAFLDYFGQEDAPLPLRTVVGRDDHPTPSIQASFHRVIPNPAWRVPMEIAKKEILPKGPGYMRREDMAWVNGRVEQKPGPKCALGRVKFDLEDPYEIYLHDTPSKALFDQPERHRSHGCVRVQNAVGFARRIATESGKGDEFDTALASGKTGAVELAQPIAVRMLYHTAYLSADGQVTLAPDVYGTDDALAAALGFGQAAAARRKEPEVLFGP